MENPLEHDEQVAVIDWCDGPDSPDGADEIFAIPNGGYRGDSAMAKIVGARLRREGVRKGVVDLMLPVARGKYHGAFIEMKRRKGEEATKDQKAFLKRMKANGYFTAVCKGSDAAIKIIGDYLEERC